MRSEDALTAGIKSLVSRTTNALLKFMTVPFDLAATQNKPEWRNDLVWPQSYGDLRRHVVQTAELVSQEVLRIEAGSLADTAIIALPALLQSTTVLSSAATLVNEAGQRSVSLAGGPPELTVLTCCAKSQADYTHGACFPPPVRAPIDVLRRIARTVT